MSAPLYILQDVRQAYAGRQVLAIDHLAIMPGEILALVGPSGAGKSTLLRLLNFLERPAAGRISFAGRPLNGAASLAARRRVTTVFQTPGLLNRTVADNIRYGLALRGRKLAPQLLEQWLARLGLAGLARQRPAHLSAGEAQRVALARALAIQPDVLLLDEPTANLDPYNVGLIESIIRQENGERGVTVVLVTHDVFQARRLGQRTGLLLNGRLVELAATGDFFDRPQQSVTAAFVRGELVY
ncbi:MAG: ATP-binding cassette domain-containing protein [Chloroflexi bacterium]|nr:ATP-binding cassette domain-containing protein [Chloroflexota bacterium]MCI0646109.1 ATP-binding cassette domain-containing protein [Chloroflexota bacterium]MCI0731565.1 ATP-binding cassette domain-containing protein [Chloroflexota bacterium]